jgi:predicted RNA-binding protein YlxR (DUF448 family)
MSAVAVEPHVQERQDDGSARERRCLARGVSVSRHHLIRFVVSPGGMVVPDIEERLPGRGMWVSADRAALDTAVRRKVFA